LGVTDLLTYMLIIYELTLYVCFWRWSCDLSNKNRWYSK